MVKTERRHQEICGRGLKVRVKFNHTCMIDNPRHRVCFPYVGACAMEISFAVLHMTALRKLRMSSFRDSVKDKLLHGIENLNPEISPFCQH